ncbi:ABC transporter substrate-binding protein [Paenibacillus senegalensis]|uniref:ABC transporter substrate-binding protein n=1 Tax=Paenibacillus senegalensis TaxID=1465766 RepID=UPI0002883990|nr:ABC transporter substrate-binding protein [Paenibacillus senegalensis]
MVNRRRNPFVVLLLALVMLAVSACGSSAPEGPGTSSPEGQKDKEEQVNLTPKEGGTITVAFSEEPDTLDVQKSGMSTTSTVGGYMGGGLLYYDTETKEIKPDLAESYTVSEDGKTLTFKIKEGITFHDGSPLTAESFKYTFERALDPATNSKSTGVLMGEVDSFEAPDEHTFIIKLKNPSAPLLIRLADSGAFQPLSQQAIEQDGDQYGRNPVGVGPWKFSGWKSSELIELVPNEDFNWGNDSMERQGPPLADKLVIKFITENQTKVAALESGTVDIAFGIPAIHVKRFMDDDKFYVLEDTRSGNGMMLQMNLDKPVFQDIRVRQALNMAIQKQAIIDSVLQGMGEVAHGPLSSTMLGYDQNIESYAYTYNLEEAGKLLDEAGWVMNSNQIREKDGQPLTLNLLASNRFNQEPQLVQGMLKELGVDVKIQTMEHATAIQMAGQGEFDLLTLSYTATDTDTLYPLLHSSQTEGLNFGQITDPVIDAALEKGRTSMNVQDRQAAYEELQRQMVEQAYWIPLYNEKMFAIVNERVQGVQFDAFYSVRLHDSWVNQ